MDISVISIFISLGVGTLQLLSFLRAKEKDKDTTIHEDLDQLYDELDYMKKDIIEIKIQNGICASDRHNSNEDIKEQLRILERFSDKLDKFNE